MEFLKAILGDELYSQFESKINEYNGSEANKDKQVKMGDTKNEILDAVKLLLGIKDNDKDGVLMLVIEDTVNSVLAYCRIDVLPRQIVSFIPTLTVKRYTANQNGGVKSVTEGERKVEYSDDNYDYLKEYAIRLKPFVSRKVKVPSEVIADDKSV